jgi:molecular chaperone DnaK
MFDEFMPLPLVQARNEADQLTYSAEKSLSEFKDKITEEISQEITTAIADVRAMKDSGSLEEVKAKTEALSKAVQKIGQHMASNTTSSKGDKEDEGSDTEDKSKGG